MNILLFFAEIIRRRTVLATLVYVVIRSDAHTQRVHEILVKDPPSMKACRHREVADGVGELMRRFV